MIISKDELIEKINFKAIENISICPLCGGIILNPFICEKCENCFCKNCINKFDKENGRNKCPFNCENTHFKKSIFLTNILSQLQFKCKNGCDEIIDYQKLEEHYNESCSKIDFKKKYFELKKKYDELCKSLEKNQNENIFISKFHPHQLIFSIDKNIMWKCNKCNKHYFLNSIKRYRCKKCDFDICENCKKKEEKEEF